MDILLLMYFALWLRAKASFPGGRGSVGAYSSHFLEWRTVPSLVSHLHQLRLTIFLRISQKLLSPWWTLDVAAKINHVPNPIWEFETEWMGERGGERQYHQLRITLRVLQSEVICYNDVLRSGSAVSLTTLQDSSYVAFYSFLLAPFTRSSLVALGHSKV